MGTTWATLDVREGNRVRKYSASSQLSAGYGGGERHHRRGRGGGSYRVLALTDGVVLDVDDMWVAPESLEELALLLNQRPLHLACVNHLDNARLTGLPVESGESRPVAALTESLCVVDRVPLHDVLRA